MMRPILLAKPKRLALMADSSSLLSLADITSAISVLEASPYVDRTGLLHVNPSRYGIKDNVELYLKLEGQQNNGSFKIRGKEI